MYRKSRGYAANQPRSHGLKVVLLLVLLGAAAAGWFFLWPDRSAAVAPLIREIATTHNLAPSLVLAVVHQESGFDADARGRVGEVGLMQITKGAATDWAEKNGREIPTTAMMFSPRTNLTIGCWYLARARNRWRTREDGVILALYEYNAGASRVFDWLEHSQDLKLVEDVPILSSRAYIKKILALQAFYLQDAQAP